MRKFLTIIVLTIVGVSIFVGFLITRKKDYTSEEIWV